jgi:hypothetical protein
MENKMSDDIWKDMKETAKEVESWPDWMKEAMGVSIKKKSKKQKEDAAFKAFLNAWADYIDNHYTVGKYADELNAIVHKIKKERNKKKRK